MGKSRIRGSQWGMFIELGVFLLAYLTLAEGSFVGVNFRPSQVDPRYFVDVAKTFGVENIRLYDTNSSILSAFAYSDIEVVVGITNDLIPTIASSQRATEAWLKDNVFVHLPTVKIKGIIVGDEDISELISVTETLLHALRNLHTALANAKLHKEILVSTTLSTSVLSTIALPSQAHFISRHHSLIKPLLDFLSETESYFMLSFNPLSLYQQIKSSTPLDYALFIPNPGVLDPHSNLLYMNLFDAVIDATYNAMAVMKHHTIPIVVSETCWTCSGSYVEEASSENAATFNKNLVRHILSNNGTPQKPSAAISTYMPDPFSEITNLWDTPEQQWSILASYLQRPLKNRALLEAYMHDIGNASAVTGQSWCIAKGGIPDNQLATALDWACGPGGADCGPIQSTGPCYNPNTYSSHASYAFNSYYQKSMQAAGSCDFGGSAMVVTSDPSYAGCTYPSSASSAGSSNQTFNPNGSNNPNFAVSLHVSSFLVSALVALLIVACIRL